MSDLAFFAMLLCLAVVLVWYGRRAGRDEEGSSGLLGLNDIDPHHQPQQAPEKGHALRKHRTRMHGRTESSSDKSGAKSLSDESK